MLRAVLRSIREARQIQSLPKRAQEEARRDRRRGPRVDPGSSDAIAALLRWLARAQDVSEGGGFARHWSLLTGWGAASPESTGALVPLLLDAAARLEDDALAQSALRAIDWLLPLQREDGSFSGGREATAEPSILVTAQVLHGLAAGAERRKELRDRMRSAADWLLARQRDDGTWGDESASPSAGADGGRAARIVCALLESARVEPGHGYAEAAERQVAWTLARQRKNGWLDDGKSSSAKAPTSSANAPTTRAIAVALRGLIELHRYARRPDVLRRAQDCADPLIESMTRDGFLAGRLHPDWTPAVTWSCLAGTAELAACCILLHEETRDSRYLDAAWRANRFVRATLEVDGADERDGGVKGSFPIDGAYAPFQYLSSACGHVLEANLLEAAALEPELEAVNE